MMTEREIRERARRRQEAKRRRHQKVIMMRAALFLAVIAVCVCTGMLVGHLGKSKRKNVLVAAQGSTQTEVPDGSTEAGNTEAGNTEMGLAGQEPRAPRRTEVPELDVIYGIYIPGSGWSHSFADGAYCMAPVGKYAAAMRISLQNQPEDMTGTVSYKVNLSGRGWLDWTENAQAAGNPDGEMALEAVSATLTGELAEYYDVLYSVLQNNAWTEWVKNGEEAGVSGAGLRVDGIRVSVVKRAGESLNYAAGIDPSKPMVALTYDDGPSARNTPKILATLKANGARATFFMVGKMAEKHPDIVAQMVEQDCEVANHTYDHTMMSKVDAAELVRQLEQTNQVVADASGISPVLMRPCGGEWNDELMGAVGSISMPAVLWSIDTLDWKTKDAQNTVNTVLEQVKDGDIILMHDLYDATAQASETLIPELINRGYQLVTVSELASYRGGILPGKNYGWFRSK